MRVTGDVLQILDRCNTDGPQLTLPGQLDRKQYLAVNKVLEAAGGKWSRRDHAHVFDEDAAGVVDQIILTGEIATSREAGWFPTPARVIGKMIELADLAPHMSVLEPSAGEGAIVARVHPLVAGVSCVEMDAGRAEKLMAAGLAFVAVRDFLSMEPVPSFDRVLMNPPFARQQDIDHVLHALKFLRPDGLLVSVMAVGAVDRLNRKAQGFREILSGRGGEFVPLPRDAFKESGTGVVTVIAVIPGSAS